MADFIKTSIKAGLLIFGTSWLFQKMKESSETDEIMNMLSKMANGENAQMEAEEKNNGDMGMNSSEMEKELEMLMLQDGGISAFQITENNPSVLPKNDNAPLSMRAAAEHLSPLADSINKVYASNNMPTNFEKINFAGRKTNVYPYTSNKIRRLQQHRARFQAQHADQYNSMGPIRGADPIGDSMYMPFQ